MEMSGAEATSDERGELCRLLARWLEESQWVGTDTIRWDEPDMYTCMWCGEEANRIINIRHATDCLVGQTLRALGRGEASDDGG